MTQQSVETERSKIGVIFWVSSAVALAFILWGVIARTSFGTVTQPQTTEAAQLGIQYSYFHWAMHPLTMYAVVGLTLGYFSFRRDEPGLISPVFRPLLGDGVDGPWGKTIDALSVLAVLFGVAVAQGGRGLRGA